VAFGTARGVIERLRHLREELGLHGIVAELNPGGRIPSDLEARSLEILARDVLPALRRARGESTRSADHTRGDHACPLADSPAARSCRRWPPAPPPARSCGRRPGRRASTGSVLPARSCSCS